MKTISIAAATTIAVLATTPLPAGAQPANEAANENVASIEVSIADLNLSSPQGKQRLSERLRFASQRVCENGSTIINLKEQNEFRSCAKDSYDRALAQANRGDVTILAMRSK